MPKITRLCPYCKKPQENYGETKRAYGHAFITLHCGHTITEKLAEQKDYESLVFDDGRTLRGYQAESCRFAEEANFRALIAHEPGLGKTVISLALLKQHPELLPCAIFVKSTLKVQWFNEIVKATGLIPQVINSGKEKPLPEIFKIFIISLDLLRNLDWYKDTEFKTVIIDECQLIKNTDSKRTNAVRRFCNKEIIVKREFTPNLPQRKRIQTIAEDLMRYHGVWGRFNLSFEDIQDKNLGLTEVKGVSEGIISGTIVISKRHAEADPENDVIETILHEIAHAITPGAGHSKIWSQTAKSIGGDGLEFAWCTGSVAPKGEFTKPMNIIALSGTPIKNNAAEFFPILNLLRPDKFGSLSKFLTHWVQTRDTMYGVKAGGLAYPEEFKKFTQDFIIRKTRVEAAPELPLVDRQFRYVELENSEDYAKEIERFEEAYMNQSGGDFTEVNNSLFKLKHLVGIDKIKYAVEFTQEFLEGTDRKLTLFVHHQDVGKAVYEQLKAFCSEQGYDTPLYLTSSLGSDVRGKMAIDFREKNEKRILIASTLSAGEGLNLQSCSDCLFVERQWNSSNEEQAEGRFVRIGQVADKVSATYLTVLGTVDEMLQVLVEKKRKIVANTLDFVDLEESDNVMKELADQLFARGKKQWKMQAV